ncbi:MAG TPA: hypothetical protein VF604_17835 [Pyrinomonadaceae bacterium]
MTKKTFLFIFFVLVLTLTVSAQATKTLILPRPTPPPGNIELINDYTHIAKRGIDAAVGEITKPGGMTISYLIGNNAESAASRMCGRKDSCLWYKGQIINGREVWLGLSKEGKIVATFPKERANFYADTKAPEDIADFLIMVMTYKVKESPVQDKTATKKPKQK